MRHPLVLGGAAAAALGRARDPRPEPAHRRLGRAGPPARPARDAGLRPASRRAFPGGAGPGGGGRQRARRDRGRRSPRASRRSSARRSRAGGCTSRSPSRPARRAGPPACSIPLDGKGTDAASNRALDTLRDQVIPATLGKVPGVTARRHGLDGRLAGLQRLHEGARAARVRVRARARVRAAAADLPLDRHPAQGDRAEPALGRRGLRRARARLPAGTPRVAAGVHVDRRRDRLAAAVPVRDPLRALDGLPRADPQPGARVPRGRHEHRGRRRPRHPRDRQASSPARRS